MRFVLVPPTLLCMLAGCGGPQMGQVHGKLTYKGQPVTAGSITFVPKAPPEQFEAGKPAVGAPNEAGEFQLSTFRLNDGALIGPHTVTYRPFSVPAREDSDYYRKRLELYKQFGHLRLPDDYSVEVKPGRNDVTLELVAGPRVLPPDDD